MPGVTPGAPISVVCTGWEPGDVVEAAEFSPLFATSGLADDIDLNFQDFVADGAGNIRATFHVPDPFAAMDPEAACPPTAAQIAQGDWRCGIGLVDASGNAVVVALDYAGVSIPPPPPSPFGPCPHPPGSPPWASRRLLSAGVTGLPGRTGRSRCTATPSTSVMRRRSASPNPSPTSWERPTVWATGWWRPTEASSISATPASTARWVGSPSNQPVVDMAPTPDGRGYWLVAADGGIFSFGDATFYGSMGGKPLNQPVVGIAADTATGGYWEVASDGGVFAFHAPFLGSAGALDLNRPVVGMAAIPGGGGYLFVASDGGIFTYGNARFAGSAGGMALAAPVVGVALDLETAGYWLVGADGGVFAFGAPFDGSH